METFVHRSDENHSVYQSERWWDTDVVRLDGLGARKRTVASRIDGAAPFAPRRLLSLRAIASRGRLGQISVRSSSASGRKQCRGIRLVPFVGVTIDIACAIKSPLEGRKRILIVDDDAAVSNVLAEMVRSLGHLAVIAWGVESALSIWHETGRAFDLAIIDHRLGDGLGEDLAHQLISEKPSMPILIASGMDEELVKLPKGVRFLRKPFSLEELWKAMDAFGRR